MRRSSFIKLTLLPILASARLVHADPGPPSNAPGADQAPYSEPAGPDAGPYDQSYQGPPGEAPVVVMPPGMTPVVVETLPCTDDPNADPDQPRCSHPVYQGYFHGTVIRGGFGGYFHSGGGGYGHGGYGG